MISLASRKCGNLPQRLVLKIPICDLKLKQAMFNLSVPYWEFIVRALAVYFFLLLAFRVTGKKQTGELSPFDLIFLLIISNAVQNSMNANDPSLLGGLVSALTLVAVNYMMSWSTFRSRKWAQLVEGRAQILIRDGQIVHEHLENQHITHEELLEALRRHGCKSPEKVHLAILETNGKISVIKEN